MMRRLVSVGIAVALVAGTLVAYRQLRPGAETYTLTADVEQAPNLFAEGRVMVRGVQVGRISSVEPRPEAVRVTMEIEAGVRIPADASLAIIPITVISDRYVQLSPPFRGGATLADGDHIPIDRTQIPAELDDVITQLKGLLAALEPKAGERRGPLYRLIRNLDFALEGRADELSGTLEGSADVLANLAASQSDLTALIDNLDRLFITLANRSSEIGLLNERLELVTESLRDDQEHLEGTIENLSFLAEEARELVSESGDTLGEDLGRLGRVLRGVLRHQDELLTVVRWTNVIAQTLGATNSSGRGTFAYTGRRTAPGEPGAEYNYRIDTRDTVGCERVNVIVQAFLELNPGAVLVQLRNGVAQRFGDSYQDDLGYLVELLIPLCADLPGGSAPLDPETAALLDELADQIGERRLEAMLVDWLVTGQNPTGSAR